MAYDSGEAPFDPVALARKYEAERAKRLRPDGLKQYVRLEGDHARFAADPHQPLRDRPAVTRTVEAVILGGGWTAILAGAELRKAGVTDVCVIEKAGDFGGTWYWNRYPGVACDTESYIYMPMLEEMGYMPEGNFASGPEILAYAQSVARRFGLYDQALFHTMIEEARWDEAASRWTIATDRGDRISARFFVMTSGALQTPKLPRIAGIGSFAGHSFHTSRWDFAYTGGDSGGGLDRLADKRVAIIGTGATAIQCIPHLAEACGHLFVVQRTPSSIDARNERPTDPAWYAAQEPGWQQRRIENFTRIVSMEPVDEDLIDDGWTRPMIAVMRRMTADMDEEAIAELIQMADFEAMEANRARVDAVVKDRADAEALKAWYNRFCKRPCFHDGYLQTYNRPNVTLIDTEGKGVDRITKAGFVARGREYPVDCIIYSTGFELGPYAETPIVPVIGRGGVPLAEKWRDGATTLHGFHVNGFPNFFVLSIIQSGWAANATHMLHEMARHVAHVVKALTDRGAARAEVSETAEAAWVAHHDDLATQLAHLWDKCTPGYFNNEGSPDHRATRNGPYAAGVMALLAILRNWRNDGGLEGLVIDRGSRRGAGSRSKAY